MAVESATLVGVVAVEVEGLTGGDGRVVGVGVVVVVVEQGLEARTQFQAPFGTVMEGGKVMESTRAVGAAAPRVMVT